VLRAAFAFDFFRDLRPNSKIKLIVEVNVLLMLKIWSYFKLIFTPVIPAICLFLVQFLLLLTHCVYNIFVSLASVLYSFSIDSA
jgi:hypothetical protein